MIQVPQGAGLLFILNSVGMVGKKLILGNDSGATRCRAAVYSELWWDGGEKLILGLDSGATRCRAAVYSELWRNGGRN
jgi:hypothetical protein